MNNRRNLIWAKVFCLFAIGCLFTAYADSIIAQYQNAAPCGELHGFAGLLQSVRLIGQGNCVTYHNPVNNAAYCDTQFRCTLAVGGLGHCTLDNSGQTCVCVPSPKGLSIAKTHSGNFFQGQTGAQYTITVSNDGSPSTGTVSVSDQVPAGLTATGIAGANWTCAQPAGPCSRIDSLATNATFESIILLVDVATDAPSSVTNIATLSGTNVVNGAAQSVTTINCHFVVDNNNDSGTGSLRDAIANACANSTITFAPNVRGAINLTTAELLISQNLTIIGPGANLLSVQRSAAGGTPAFRIFNITSSVNATISDLTIANGNTPGSKGGGVSNSGALTITNSTISGNAAAAGGGVAGGGGGIYNTGALSVTKSTISGNTTSSGNGGGNGGGIYNTGTLNLTNSTISGNSAGGGIFYGGGIFNDNDIGGTVTITNGTISGNTAQYRGGGIAYTVTARNTIIAQNSAGGGVGPDVNGALTSQGFNFIGNSSGATITPAQSSDQIGTPSSPIDPLLGPLQDNGGPTFTRALLSGSPAINAGDDAFAPKLDQRGYLRLGISDIGAFEFGGGPLKITSITRLSNGHIVLQGFGVPGLAHTLYFSPDLSSGFTAPTPLTADAAGALTYDDAGAVGLTKRFYRLTFP